MSTATQLKHKRKTLKQQNDAPEQMSCWKDGCLPRLIYTTKRSITVHGEMWDFMTKSNSKSIHKSNPTEGTERRLKPKGVNYTHEQQLPTAESPVRNKGANKNKRYNQNKKVFQSGFVFKVKIELHKCPAHFFSPQILPGSFFLICMTSLLFNYLCYIYTMYIQTHKYINTTYGFH